MTKVYARVAGWIFLLIGLLGFFMNDLFGLIQFDTTHNIVHLVLGVLGIAAGQSVTWSRLYAQVFGTIYVLLGILGFFLPDLLGYHHLEVTENLVHVILGAWGLYAVLGATEKASE
ncbi:hypothetical protein CIG75_05700 [Tumebacillus algifaecis]|uniref:DUF4383 domain-containing protein n=1 Tax=Tumebacillus algifaecis TaxID=1214604 RepID=A0A223CYX2_9BACL|nr:DUF4383 domain-containing protein [Tumebacillus algifaecis]ASS74541.1 hypothetical protein CIG75_05700 [Tumebacillus algifaecis]